MMRGGVDITSVRKGEGVEVGTVAVRWMGDGGRETGREKTAYGDVLLH